MQEVGLVGLKNTMDMIQIFTGIKVMTLKKASSKGGLGLSIAVKSLTW